MCQVALVEAVRIETQKVIREDLELRLHLTLWRLERFGVDNTAKLLVNSVVLDGKEILEIEGLSLSQAPRAIQGLRTCP